MNSVEPSTSSVRFGEFSRWWSPKQNLDRHDRHPVAEAGSAFSFLPQPPVRRTVILSWIAIFGCLSATSALGQTAPVIGPVEPGRFKALIEPPCSYCSTQHRKGLIRDQDRVLAWLRGSHNGGAFPIRHFIAGQRVINDTYGLFFYDPDGGFVSAFRKDYGYELYGWRNGVMVVQGKDGTLWSALSGIAFDGPLKGERLARIPSLTTNWSYWIMLHPESTA